MIPGVSPKIDGFGMTITEHFGIRTVGDYSCDLIADDGARLFIDGSLIKPPVGECWVYNL